MFIIGTQGPSSNVVRFGFTPEGNSGPVPPPTPPVTTTQGISQLPLGGGGGPLKGRYKAKWMKGFDALHGLIYAPASGPKLKWASETTPSAIPDQELFRQPEKAPAHHGSGYTWDPTDIAIGRGSVHNMGGHIAGGVVPDLDWIESAGELRSVGTLEAWDRTSDYRRFGGEGVVASVGRLQHHEASDRVKAIKSRLSDDEIALELLFLDL